MSRQTILDYLKRILDTGYFTLLPKFSWSIKEQKVNPQKIICLDLGIRNRVVFRFTRDEGKAAENIVGHTLVRQGRRLYYWQGKQEVDFVTHEREGLGAINVTFGPSMDERELEGLLELKREFNQVKDLTLITKETEEKRKGIKLIPLWKWLLGRGVKSSPRRTGQA